MKKTASILSIGAYVPQKVLPNSYFENLVDTTNEWIVERTGIHERRIASDEESCSQMGYLAACSALQKIGLPSSDLDLILCATLSPDYIFPSTACTIQKKLGIANCPSFDIGAACSGFLYAISVAKAYIESGMYEKILVVCSEKMSSYINYSDRSTCILFGDGASAAVIGRSDQGLNIEKCIMGSDGNFDHSLFVPGGGSKTSANETNRFLQMDGKTTFKFAVKRMVESTMQIMEENGITGKDIAWFVPHQANSRILRSVAKKCNIPESKVVTTLEKYGNTSASSIGITLSELYCEMNLKDGDIIISSAFGAGFTWSSALLRYKV